MPEDAATEPDDTREPRPLPEHPLAKSGVSASPVQPTSQAASAAARMASGMLLCPDSQLTAAVCYGASGIACPTPANEGHEPLWSVGYVNPFPMPGPQSGPLGH